MRPSADPHALTAGELIARPRVAAIMTAFNEGDVIDHAIRALVEDGVDVYVIDNCSTDDTVEQAESWLGRGVLKVERFPDDAGGPDRARGEYMWRELLTRVEQVAHGLDHDWFLFVNPDEFRESPWPDLDLVDGLGFVDALGYSAINFELFDFQPIDDDFVPGTDVREHIRMYETGAQFNALQIKGWKAHPEAELAWSGGHDTRFPGRRLFPIPFILRHYGLRGETHGRRKVFGERMPRFTQEERADGWHVQYDAYLSGEKTFLRDPATLVEYDGATARAQLLARSTRDMALRDALRSTDATQAPIDAFSAVGWAMRATGEHVDTGNLSTALETLARGSAPTEPTPVWVAAARIIAVENRMSGALDRAHSFTSLTHMLAERVTSPAPAAVDGARGFVTLASADEVVADPSQLAAYAAQFGPEDDATLVIYGHDADESALAARLGPAIEFAGVASEESPDMLAVVVPPGAEQRLLVHAKLGDGSDLRALAEAHWKAPSVDDLPLSPEAASPVRAEPWSGPRR
jgi:hypothetical protein